MTIQLSTRTGLAGTLSLLLAMLSPTLLAQVPVDDDGNVIGAYESQPSATVAGNEDIPLLTTVDLEELIGPIALYPDDLLAIVLPASVYPLQIVDAARFLEDLKVDPALEPNPEWDDAVVALLNYPEVIELLNDEIDWTWRLGEAVVAQQADVVAAIETFRDRAYAAGNLKSDSYQNVTHDAGAIQITPVSEDTIYVPYYEPERVVVYQPRPVYYYYPTPYPVYYYPYSSSYFFDRSPFWGVTTAFRIGWYSDSLSVFHHSYYGHPYYGRNYQSRWWYRRPSINIYNTTYVQNNTRVTVNRHYDGDRWRHRQDRRRHSIDDVRIASSRSFQRQAIQRRQTNGDRSVSHRPRVVQPRKSAVGEPTRQRLEPDRIKFRARTTAPVENRRESSQQRRTSVKFRERSATGSTNVARNNVRVAQQQERRTEQRTSSARPRIDQRRPGYKSANDVRRVAPASIARRSVETKLARRDDATPRTTQRKQASRPESREPIMRSDQRRQATRAQPRAEPRAEARAEPRQRKSQETARKVSKRQAEPQRTRSSKSPGKFAARSKRRD